MIRIPLIPFGQEKQTVEAHCTILNFEDGFVLQFQLDGDWEAYRKPPPKTTSARLDELWKTTCFECFVAPIDSKTYTEFNISPSGDWNAYSFDAYRTGMRPAPDFLAPRIYQSFSSSQSTRTDVLIPKPDSCSTGVVLHPTLVLESKEGSLSYWAAIHPATKADFHRREYFSVRI